MLFYLTSRLVGTATAFLYPAYSSYKTLSQRPASEADLERWLMYWSVLGTLLVVEYWVEWIVSWVPFYYLIKTIFLLYLALPQTQGSTYIYLAHLAPLLHEHEDEIDRSMGKLKAWVWEYVQAKARAVWDALLTSMGQPPAAQQAQAQTSAPPTMNDPASGTVQMLWRTYGPTLLTTGAALFSQIAPGQQAQQQRQTSFFTERPQPQHASSSASSMSRTQSIHERRRALEEELAALERIDPGSESDTSSLASPPAFPIPMPSMAMAANAMSSSSSRTTSPGSSPYLRGRTASGVGLGRFEEIEMPPEGYDVGPDHGPGQPTRQRSSGWFSGWGASMGGHEREKED
ncbi:receptor expression-enhancing protein 4 [Moniliophthora roreri MCA 2997]|uniref:Protein YOP1 n=2 Tax=Moniliophthora roreri TaxID=221103 RepID=V2XTW3_MONRO|nr:receptor expression-enhancing protein 4 [Moniliophthora roreri MCA 2997]KAI3604151.1 receptor expression-enhancing protein 4 [Moniliophthora roreri]